MHGKGILSHTAHNRVFVRSPGHVHISFLKFYTTVLENMLQSMNKIGIFSSGSASAAKLADVHKKKSVS